MLRRRMVLIAIMLGTCAWADEAADRVAITRTLTALNLFPERNNCSQPMRMEFWHSKTCTSESRSNS
jgi:hypothetical protein